MRPGAAIQPDAGHLRDACNRHRAIQCLGSPLLRSTSNRHPVRDCLPELQALPLSGTARFREETDERGVSAREG